MNGQQLKRQQITVSINPQDSFTVSAASSGEHAYRRVQTLQVLGVGARGALASMGFIVAMLWMFGAQPHGPDLWWWGLVMLALNALRLLAARRGARAVGDAVLPWAAIYAGSLLVSALLWGLSTSWFGRGAPSELNLFLAFAVAGLVSGSVAVLAPLPWLYRAYLGLAVMPVVIDYLLRGTDFYPAIGLLFLLAIAVLEAAGRQYQKVLIEVWEQRRQNDGLVVDLHRTNRALLTINARMLDETEARERSEARFHRAFDQSAIGMAFSDGQRLLEVNRALATMLGLTPAELIGRPLSGLLSRPLTPVERAEAILDLKHHLSREYPFAVGEDTEGWFLLSFANLASEQHADAPAYIVQFIDVSRAREMSSRLIHQARHDELTGLANRIEFEARLEGALARSRNDGSPHAVCYFDLDQFKLVNDTCGHAAGDQLLRQVATTLASIARKTDTIARVGGDEFVLLMEHCTVQQGQRTAQAVRKALEDIDFVWDHKRFRISASIGMVPVLTGEETVADILSAADAACFTAKELGRNRVHTFATADEDLALRQAEMGWVERINRAIDENRLELFYQSIEPTVPNDHYGRHIEVLVRLREEDGRLIAPGEFLPPAERYHIITRIDRWVIERVLRFYAETSAFAQRIDLCSINLSGQSLGNEEFFAFVYDAMQRMGPLASRFCFEITETAAIANLGAAEKFISELRALGCKFSLDDFGSGLSSFGYLKRLQVDHLKIDGVFIRDLLTDPVDFALVRAINEVGHTLGKITIAEFVENDQVRAKLAEIGVNCVQGYGIGRPRPLVDLLAAESA